MLLKEFLQSLGVSQVAAANRMNIPFRRPMPSSRAARGVSDTALLLEALTGWNAQIRLTLPAKWGLWLAMKG